ncbi:1,2-phenylacetyl-CoA epoxidase subunit PaaD [Ferruginibacter sp. HRS2-29]|uniref:1,2-phenylacetyl-CoA epoxidase subunit PaaD n=1 Tax=Ferruginibacter sp. HRS2-29 TaxID=2487334 RepID=UPI0020CFDBD9|nr:1,2-phenylacetyl-CoA epoxidase subunit PaaD [Ferruginibacter sp. HRS2-29]MCP9752077.1 phenylacetate-CoA oxygenase subunit PaaJ [Ferruginibacter sp. HRS2-29]
MAIAQSYKNISAEAEKVWKLLETVADPEVPVLSILDLGIVREVSVDRELVEVTITPTYTGCPAMDAISMDIKFLLFANGYKNVKVISVLSPAWTTDWMTESGRQKLKAYGIAPPNVQQQVCSSESFGADETIQCPQCNSYHTHLVSRFGSTACKALYQCDDCKEPFDYFKCH